MPWSSFPSPISSFERLAHSVARLRRTLSPRRAANCRKMSQESQYTVVLHMRYSVMWCLRHGVIVCWCVCVRIACNSLGVY